jgi:hypothetical protein
MSVQTIARSKGGNAVAAAAYRAGERIEKYDYSRKSAVDFKAIYAPQNAPEWRQIAPSCGQQLNK